MPMNFCISCVVIFIQPCSATTRRRLMPLLVHLMPHKHHLMMKRLCIRTTRWSSTTASMDANSTMDNNRSPWFVTATDFGVKPTWTAVVSIANYRKIIVKPRHSNKFFKSVFGGSTFHCIFATLILICMSYHLTNTHKRIEVVPLASISPTFCTNSVAILFFH